MMWLSWKMDYACCSASEQALMNSMQWGALCSYKLPLALVPCLFFLFVLPFDFVYWFCLLVFLWVLPLGFAFWFCLLVLPLPQSAFSYRWKSWAEFCMSSLWALNILWDKNMLRCFSCKFSKNFTQLHWKPAMGQDLKFEKIFSPQKITDLISSYQTIWTKHHSITPTVQRQSHIDQLTQESGHWSPVLDLNTEPDHSGHVSCWSSQALLLPTPLSPPVLVANHTSRGLQPPMTWPMRSKRSGLGDNEEQEGEQQVQIEWCSGGDRGGGCVWLVAAHRHYLLPSHLWPAAAGGANHPPPPHPPSHPLLRRLSLFAPVLGTFLRQPLRWRTDPINTWCFSKHVRIGIRVNKLE